ncbi:hypothetical protein [Methylibium sp.]|uniref:hypothetical protein n=1 Tax=Methylibium sp. TaxID=2067992 RepID=UPI00333FF956
MADAAYTFEPGTPEAAAYIAAHLRDQDRAELAVMHPGEDAERLLLDALHGARWCNVVRVEGRPALIYGVTDTAHAGIGVPWLLATPDLYRIKEAVREVAMAEVRLMAQTYVVLFNQVHAENTTAIEWLETLGFTIDRERPVGPTRALYNFWMGDIARV